MARRNPPAKWVLPLEVDPPRACFQIEVPLDIYHMAAFRGAILNLAAAYKWQDDPDHTAKRVAAVWDDIYTKIKACQPGESNNTGISLEDFMSQQIRISPDDSCIIQMWCIDHWEDWYDPRSCIPGTIEQPTDGTALDPGQCRSWDVSLRANEKWLLPLEVDEGDTISVTGASGAWNDGGLGWNCVDGHTYALGACVSTDPAVSGDPLMTVDHMRLVMSVATVFYDAYNVLFAVPSGVSGGQVFFQANDSALDNNSGSVSFRVEVCKPSNPVTSFDIDMHVGTGPTSVLPGQLFTCTSALAAGLQNVEFGVDPCGALTVVSVFSWSTPTVPGSTAWNVVDCASANHIVGAPTALQPTVVSGQECSIYGLNGAGAFSVTCRIDPL